MAEAAQRLVREAMKLQQAGDLSGAGALYRQALEREPGNADALHLSGLVCLQLGDFGGAVNMIGKAVDRVPKHPVLRNNLGLALHRAGDLPAAAEQLGKALAMRADYAGAHMNLGAVYSDLGDMDRALEHGLESVRLAPERAEAWHNLGLFRFDRVELAQAIEAFRRALVINPEHAAAATSLLYTLHLAPGIDPDEVASEHRRVSAAVYGTGSAGLSRRLSEQSSQQSSQQSSRRLTHQSSKQSSKQLSEQSPANRGEFVRVAFLSADFRRHAVNHFFEPLLAHLDRERFHITAYSDTVETDPVTDRLRRRVDVWVEARRFDDESLARRIQEDGIDVLVDLAGHTKGNRLGVLARRPASLQLGWLGYPGHTGLEALDGQVVDRYTTRGITGSPAGDGLLPLPAVFACFRPAEHAPAPTPPPVHERGFVTLGSLHKLEKINEEVVACWAKTLWAVPNARLLLVRDHLNAWQRSRLLAKFNAHGIDSERLELGPGKLDHGSFQEIWADIDICLDTFPWSGHTMACHALWCGVPVVTLAGRSHASRMVASTLAALGRQAWIAEDEVDYVARVVSMTQDLPALAKARAMLREQMAASPVMDAAAFARDFEALLEEHLDPRAGSGS